MKVNKAVKLTISIVVAGLIAGAFLSGYVYTPASIRNNIEALSANEVYYLSDCWEKGYLDYPELNFFCHKDTEEMVKYSCELEYAIKSSRSDQCVRDKK